ncbi:MAG: cytochrome BD quinol oxidase subunit I [Phycisphaeraceae bacterium]|nr:cytochrome BD quinol oxidase subunit I [Phycisphaeraceae bacterium]
MTHYSTLLADVVYFPLNDFGPAMKGMIIGGLGIFHVFVAQFAIGGGLLMCYFQWLAMTGREPHARQFLDGFYKVLVLISFVVGAVTGVGMWFTSIQISPVTIGVMIDQFHWLWATEWTFFCLEVGAGYAFYRYAQYLNDKARLTLLIFYAFAAWMSLFWINGILAFQLTPGGWHDDNTALWQGFFNPTYFPTLFFRTVTCMVIASLAACVVINAMPGLEREDRRRLILRCAHFMVMIVLMPVFGLWFLAVIPADSRSWVMGGSAAMTMFANISIGATILIGGYAVIGLFMQRLYINGATATLLMALAFGATAGGEFVREGIRKPYTIRKELYSNSITPDQVATLRKIGSVTNDPYPVRNQEQYPNEQVILGQKVYRFQCSVCHTIEGANGLMHLTGAWDKDMLRKNIAKLQHLKTFMPPFSGNALELEALVQRIDWQNEGQPETWPISNDPAVLEQNRKWLDEAGTQPGWPKALARTE